MRAGLLSTALIIVRSVYATLRITVATVYEVYRGIYRREDGDARLRWWSGRLLELIDLRYRVVGGERMDPAPRRPTIVMSNHGSLYDIPLVFVTLPGSIRMLTKKELFRVPLWGRGMRAGEFISIDRHNRQQAFRDLDEARKKMESGIILWVAPEGTRSSDGSLGAFKKGGFMLALQTGATIVPVGIRGAHDVLPARSLAVRLGQEAEVHVGEPIDASAYSLDERDNLMAAVEAQIRRLAAL